MSRTTIDFGIDLGTTNSSIAVFQDGNVEIFRNNEQFEFTPSAVWIDKHNSLIVGRSAYQHLESDPDNAYSEFKRLMGTTNKVVFARNGLSMTPEELSAQVLKSLKQDVRVRTGEEITAAVITVPADSDLTKTAATNRAAQLAGFNICHLLQEPAAAGLSYGFQSQSDKVFWLVYDFGGGTFDTAIIQVRDGVIEVVNHEGDDLLGGKDIDWAIVENLLVPALLKGHKLENFKRSNKVWRAAFAKLKSYAEEAKIKVSRLESCDISIDFTSEHNFPEHVIFDYELTRPEVAALARPFVVKTINLCKKVLTEKRLARDNIEKVILVGGPTIAPYVRDHLADENEGLGIPLVFNIDPITVVARGAAIFAGDQIIPIDYGPLMHEAREKGNYTVTFPDWNFTGSDIEPVVAGIVEAPIGQQGLEGFFIELSNKTVDSTIKPWRSGKISMTDGRFMTTLWADKKHLNTYSVELFNSTGNSVNVITHPERLTYTVGLIFTDPPLTHSLGVGLVNNEFLTMLEKGTPLPAKACCRQLKTTVEVNTGHKGGLIRIPVYEGENARADRNRRITKLEILSHHVKHDVPAGSDIEVTIEIDRSRLIRTTAFIPILDEEFEDVISMQPEDSIDQKTLRQDFERERKRLNDNQEKAKVINDKVVKDALQIIDDERIIQEIETSLIAASNDPDSAMVARRRIIDLRGKIDDLEDALEWPSLVFDAEHMIDVGKEIIQQLANSDEKRIVQAEEAQLRISLEEHDPELLRQRIESYRAAYRHILIRTGVLHVIFFQNLSDEIENMRDRVQAEQLIADGQRAMNSNDADRLQAINRQLVELLPTPIPDVDTKDLPTITRKLYKS